MKWINERLSGWFRWARRGRYEADLEEELQFHLEERTRHLTQSGLSVDEARRQAQREFGSKETAKDYCRDQDRVQWFDELRRNLTFARRLFVRKRGLFASIVVTLGLCIAANVMIFAVVDAVLLKTLPYPNADRLHIVETLHGEGLEQRRDYVNGQTWFAVDDGVKTAVTTVYSPGAPEVNFVPPDAAVHSGASLVRQQRVGRRFFEVLGVPLARGRSFTRAEDVPNGPQVAVISYRLWQEEFGGDERALDSRFTLAGEPHTLVGIAGPRFTSRNDADVWVPLRASVTGEGSGTNYQVMLRTADDGAGLGLEAELAHVGQELDKLNGDPEIGVGITALHEYEVGELQSRLLLLWLAVALVLLIGCVNVAGLLLSTARQRAAEIATRRALGGGVASVFRQLITESLFLATCGGLLGVGLAMAGLRWLEVLNADTLGLWQEFGMDGRLLLVVLLVTLATTAIFGIAPAIAMARSAASQMGGRSGARTDGFGRRALVVMQVAVGVGLLLTAGLLVRTLLHLGGANSGVDGRNLYTATISLNDKRFEQAEATTSYFDRGVRLLESEPVVMAAGAALSMPYERGLNWPFRVLGEEQLRVASVNYVVPGTLSALGVEPKQGRPLAATDTTTSPRVAVVNQSFVEQYLTPETAERSSPTAAVGRLLEFNWDGQGAGTEIVGVVGDVRQRPSFNWRAPLQSDVPTVYLPIAQMDAAAMRMAHTWFRPSWVIKTTSSGGEVAATIRNSLDRLDPLTPVASVRRLGELRRSALAMERFQAILFSLLAGLAVVLASVGVAATTASSFERRRKEVGIRLALGATLPAAIGRVALPGLLVVLVGLVVGLGLAQLGARGVGHMLYGVSQQDPMSYVAAVVGLMAVAGVACLLPALRVARLPVVDALQKDEG